VQLLSELEQRLGVSIGDEEFERIATLGELRQRFAPERSASAPANSQGIERNAHAAPSTTLQPRRAPRESHREQVRYRYAEWTWWPPVQALRWVFQEAVIRPLVWFLGAPKVRRSDFPTPGEPLLMIANHVTAYDPALVLYALPAAVRRKVAIAMSAEVLEDLRHGRNMGNWLLNLLAPIGYWLITVLFNVFPLPPSAGFQRSFSHAGRAMDRGYHVLIFPEGRRSADGTLLPFRAGIGLLARESSANILPVALLGLGELIQQRRWFRSGTLRIRVGTPLAPDPELSPVALADSLRNALVSLMQP
jgi:long-chain acyl-CoA synthetase